MSTQIIQDEFIEYFTADLIFSSHTEKITADKASIDSYDISGTDCWKITAAENTINETTYSDEVNLFQFFLDKNSTSFDHALATPEPYPVMTKNSGYFYKYTDSPDDIDKEVDTANNFPLRNGWITYQWNTDKTYLRGTFDLTVENPGASSFRIMGGFNLKKGGVHRIKTNEEFVASVQYPTSNLEFKAVKVRVEPPEGTSEDACWKIEAFQEIVEGGAIKEVQGIHLYIARTPLEDNQPMAPAKSLPATQKNSASFFRIIDHIPDAQNKIDTTVDYLGISGHISYRWESGRKRVLGEFSVLVIAPDKTNIQIRGHFNVLTGPPRLIY